jgi:gliding motility-associated-like protein
MLFRRLLLLILLLHTIPAFAQFTCPPNIDFEDGNTGSWKFYTGTCCPIATPTLTTALPNRHVITSGTGTDYYGGFPVVAPGGGTYSLKLGNNSTGAQAERATYFVHVPAGVNNYSLIYRYAVVFENPSHTASQQPRFEVKAYDSTTGASIACGQFTYVAAGSLPGFSLSPNGYEVWYRSWATASIDLSGQAGKTIAVDFASGDCALGGHFGYGYVDLNCSLFQIVNVNCNGAPTTTLSAPPGFQTYQWYNSSYTQVATGQSVTIATPSTTSQYYVVLTPYAGYGCPDTLSTTVSVSSLIVNASNDTFVCNSGSVQLAANATGTATTYNYNWTPATGLSCTNCATPVAAPVNNTTYNVTVTDGNGCIQTDSVRVAVSPTANATASNLLCNGATTGTATITATQGQLPYTYFWNTSPAQTSGTATGLGAGNYMAIVTDANGCADTATVNITQPAAINITISTSNVLCSGVNNGSASASATGGNPPYTYSWNTTPPQTTAAISNLAAGNYIVTVTDGNGCSQTDTAVIVQPSGGLTASTSVGSVSCNGGTNGSATVSVNGGTAPYTYLWNTTPAQTAATATNLSAGNYSVTVTDANGCSINTAITINEPSALTASLSSTFVNCFGDNTATASVSVSGGTTPYSYSWNTTPTQTTNSINNISGGNYIVTVTDANGCALTDTAIIIQPSSALTANILTTSNVNCHGGADGTTTITATGGTAPYSYSWNTTPAQTIATATGLAAGTYTATITDAHGCATNATASISQPTALSVTTLTTNVSCFGGTNGTATATANGGTAPYSYSWTSGAAAATANNLAAGSYTVTVTDAHGCIATASVAITEPVALTAGFTQTNISCAGGNGTATVTPSGGTAPYTYLWNTTPAQTTASISNLSGGTYQVSVTDNNGCTYSGSVTITQPANAVTGAVTTTDVSCYNGSNGTATVTATGGVSPYSYSWNTTPVQTAATISNLSAGTYIATITDANGCFTTATAIINQPAVLAPNTTATDVNCNGGVDGTATVTATGGTAPYSYSWNTTPAQTTATATGLAAGTYVATITDAHGCSTNATSIVNQPSAPVNAVVTSSPVNCSGANNATATVTGSGGTAPYTYSWNTTPVQTTATAVGLGAGTYTATVTDVRGCSATTSVSISQPVAPVTATVSTTTPVVCNGGANGNATVLASGGTQPYSYSWNTTPVQTATTAINLTAGSYMVVVSDANGCSDTATATITQPAAFVTSFSNTNVTCFGNSNGTGSVTVTGGVAPYTYSWNTTPVQATPSIANLSAGTYTVAVTDNKGCSTTGSITITQPAQLIASIPVYSNISCAGMNNGSASAIASGGTAPYSYSWNTAQTTAFINNLPSGTYAVNVTDNNGCTAIDSMALTEPLALTTTSGNIVPVKCHGDATGSANVIVTGGTAPYNYSWNTAPSQSTANATNLAAGAYIVTVTDSNGCSKTDSVSISEPNAITLATSATKTCPGSNTASALVNINGGIAPYSVLWNTSPVQTTTTVNNLATGNYTVTVTDGNGCTQSAIASVSSYPAPVVDAGPDQKVCIGSDLQLQVSGANSYSWSPATWLSCSSCESPVTHPNSDITYTVVGTDANSCTDTAVVHITVIDHVPVSIDENKEMCESDTVRLTATGGIAYNWTPPYGLTNAHVSNPLASPSATTQYQVVIIENECFSDTLTQTVTVHPLPVINLGPDKTVMAGTEMTIPAETNNATSIAWAPPAGLSCTDCTNPVATLNKTITYTATAYNSVGCKASDEVTYTVICDNSVLFMPNTFTPNGDGLNDTYYPIGRGISTIKRFAIYNRWGQKLYEVLNIPASEGKYGWDGTFQGIQLRPDVFVYVVDAICTTGDPITLKGDVSLVR